MPSRLVVLLMVFLCLTGTAQSADQPALQQTLMQEPIAALARAARERGDAARGAVLFFQPFLNCAKCHDNAAGTALGPDLTKLGKDGTAEHLIESVLLPSKVIKKEYQTVLIATTDGRIHTGFVAEEKNGTVTLVDPAGGKTTVLKTADIEQRTPGKLSLMPEGLANLLSDRQQFLDLTRYLIDIAEQGPRRAQELRPAQTALMIPAYEKEIDHAGLIRSLDGKALRRGEAIYTRICGNCHGTMVAAGSMPTSLRFGSEKFKNGSDPYSLYQTLTHGYGRMAPQTWMVPRQKYDVIHYLRETFLKTHNPTQYAKVDAGYLDKLPHGTTFGPPAVTVEPWVTMDYGPSMMNTFEVGGASPNFAYKGIAVRLDAGAGGVSRGQRWALFDHDTMRFAAAWSGKGFIDWKGIHFNGQHQVHPKLVGEVQVANPTGPGWANPETGRFDDPRLVGRDGRRYGPLPRAWAQYKGMYHFGDQTIISYTVGTTQILEAYGSETDPKEPGQIIFTRTLEIGPSSHTLCARIAPSDVAVALVSDAHAALTSDDAFTLLKLPPSTTPRAITVLMAKGNPDALQAHARTVPKPHALLPLTHGGPRHWPETLHMPATLGKNDGPFAVDTFELPQKNPWNAQLRLTGFDFYPDGKSAAVCSWDGDVWKVTGLDQPQNGLTWQRIASGMFQPLGLKFRDEKIYVCCRDQIVCLHDLNGDGETDFYECFNNDHQVTEHFHEFAMGLQTDAKGNFYYAKSGRHALPALVPHHGTLLKVSKDGTRTEILATGFRAANGVCLNPDGTFFVTDQEGFWTPKNRINLVEKGGFYGNLWGYTDIKDDSDKAMKQPLCWVTNDFDRSPAELVWVTSDKWGPLKGALLNTSYGNGKIFVVPFEKLNGQAQGGMCALPLSQFPTGIMRPRFHPTQGHLYVCGMYAWAGDQTKPGGFYRVRYTGKPADLPVGLMACSGGVEITFTDPIDPTDAALVKNYQIKVWGLIRSKNYGSKHIDERILSATNATLLPDGKTVRLHIAGLAPTRGMEIQYRLKGTDGRAIVGVIHNTIHALPETAPVSSAQKPVKVYILAGQSNMEGKAPNALLDHQASDPQTQALFAHLRKDGKWIERDDVFIKYLKRHGPLTIGYGSPNRTGVELEFGTAMGDHFDEPVILLKTAWGGHSLYKLFRSPSAGLPSDEFLEKELKQAQDRVRKHNEKNKRNDPLPTMAEIQQDYGSSYRMMLEEVKDLQENYGTLFPALKGRPLELAGFVWFQGWNDQYGAQEEYASNMKHFIRDVRKDLKVPKLPFVIGVMGQNGSKPATGAMLTIQQAQLSMNEVPEFKGNVKAIRTDLLVDKAAEDLYPTWQKNEEQWQRVGGDHPYHYLGSAIWFNRIGKAMGDAMLALMAAPDPNSP